ncbi:MAG: hypothetical protein CL754_05740 [Chloroflexi bacterium]|nr:hypothetical protein [Chloroflexota bacterium]
MAPTESILKDPRITSWVFLSLGRISLKTVDDDDYFSVSVFEDCHVVELLAMTKGSLPLAVASL